MAVAPEVNGDSGVRDRTAPLLRDKVVVITGAGSGVGRASARLFAAQGAKVVCGDLRQAWVDETVALATKDGGDAVAVACDVSVDADVERLVATATTEYGRLDVMFNNAGISLPRLKIADHTDEVWDQLMNVNLRGVFYGCKHAVATFMKQESGGSIINTSSVSGLVGFGGVGYVATKGGVNQLTKGLAVEVAPLGIRVNAICPGSMLTNLTKSEEEASFDDPTDEMLAMYGGMNPSGIAVLPEDIADAALFLASDMSISVTGVALPVDQGYVAR